MNPSRETIRSALVQDMEDLYNSNPYLYMEDSSEYVFVSMGFRSLSIDLPESDTCPIFDICLDSGIVELCGPYPDSYHSWREL